MRFGLRTSSTLFNQLLSLLTANQSAAELLILGILNALKETEEDIAVGPNLSPPSRARPTPYRTSKISLMPMA